MEADASPLGDAVITQIRVEMAERRMDQKTLAGIIGVQRATLNRYMMGHHSIPMPVFWRIADAFGMPADELMRRAEHRI